MQGTKPMASKRCTSLAGIHLISAILAALVIASGPARPEPAEPGGWLDLFRAEATLGESWQHVPLRGETSYRATSLDRRSVIEAQGRNSASVLLRWTDLDPNTCPILEWSWRVEQVQAGADLTRRDGDDVAAAILVLFGDPGPLWSPVAVPTLRYVWAGDAIAIGSVVDNPYLPDVVKSVVVRSGERATGQWLIERRSLIDDFRQAFGREPEDQITAIGLFTDNDQTGEAARAFYEWGRAQCNNA